MILGLAATGAAQQPPQTPDADKQLLPHKVYPFSDMEVKTNPQSKSRKVFTGALHNGFIVNCHITELQPGVMSHPAHQHAHEEIIMIKEGTCESTVDGKTDRFGPGGVSFISSGVLHSLKNVGTTPATYFVVELRGDGH